MFSDDIDEMFGGDGYKACRGVMGMIYDANPYIKEQHEQYRREEAEADRLARLREYTRKFDEQRALNGSRSLDEIMGY